MALGEKNKKNSPLGGNVKKTEKITEAQKAIDNVVRRINYNDFKDTVEKIMRAK